MDNFLSSFQYGIFFSFVNKKDFNFLLKMEKKKVDLVDLIESKGKKIKYFFYTCIIFKEMTKKISFFFFTIEIKISLIQNRNTFTSKHRN